VLLAPLLAESDQIDMSGSIVASEEYEADRKGTAKKRKSTTKGAKPQTSKPRASLQGLQLEPALATVSRIAPATNRVISTVKTSVPSP